MTDTTPSAATTTPSIRRILVPIDGSEASLEALAFALRFPGAALTLLQVGSDLAAIFPDLSDDDVDAVSDDIRRDLDAVASPLRDSGHAVETITEIGDPADRIVEVAAREGVDLIAMSTRGRGAAARMLFGSVADRVSRSASVPVLLVRQELDDKKPTNRVVVPLDGSARAELALPVASSLSKSLGLPIELARVVTIDEVLRAASKVQHTIPGRAVDTTDETFAVARTEAEQDAADYLDEVAERLAAAGTTVSKVVLHGSPADALLHDLTPTDLTVISSHGTSGFSRWLLGSVAEKLVREASSPTVVVPARDEDKN